LVPAGPAAGHGSSRARGPGNERLVHLVQTFVAMPVAFVAGALFLWFGRASEEGRGWRSFAWVVVVTSGLWLAFLAYVLLFADFSWMNQK
jgi:hypothetical protein